MKIINFQVEIVYADFGDLSLIYFIISRDEKKALFIEFELFSGTTYKYLHDKTVTEAE